MKSELHINDGNKSLYCICFAAHYHRRNFKRGNYIKLMQSVPLSVTWL